MRAILGFSPSPYSTPKFVAYMLAMAAIAGLALTPARHGAPDPAPTLKQDGRPQAAVLNTLRFGKPADEIRDSLPSIGIPWFLRRAGVTSKLTDTDPGQLVVTLTWNGKPVGRYFENLQPIDPDRTRLSVAFEPADPALVQRLATPIDTTLDPTSLFRATLAEHIRSSIDGDRFSLSVLKPGPLPNKLTAALNALRHEPNRDTDTFPLTPADSEAAAIRHAYNNEAKRAAPLAPKL